jgi:Fe-S cluster assembly iron-binding protein IscA
MTSRCSRNGLQTAASPERVAVDDLVIARDRAVVLVDDLIGASFRVVNPNATASCGCGTSFSI